MGFQLLEDVRRHHLRLDLQAGDLGAGLASIDLLAHQAFDLEDDARRVLGQFFSRRLADAHAPVGGNVDNGGGSRFVLTVGDDLHLLLVEVVSSHDGKRGAQINADDTVILTSHEWLPLSKAVWDYRCSRRSALVIHGR
jgi:hypothetical protein